MIVQDSLTVLPDRPAGGATAPPAIRVKGLRKSFGDKLVLDGFDIDVARGESIALIGANGSGKSTCLRCLVRLIEPSAGTIEVLGETVTSLPRGPLGKLRARVGFVFQRHNLVPRLSALSNVLHGVQSRERGPRTWLQSLARPAVRDEALSCLEAVGLLAQARQRVDSLSGGQSQRVAIARMLMQRPELVLADEPDASLDPRTGDEIMELLHRLAKAKTIAMVVVSHRLEHAKTYSDRIIGLSGGRISLSVESRSADPATLRAFFEEPEA